MKTMVSLIALGVVALLVAMFFWYRAKQKQSTEPFRTRQFVVSLPKDWYEVPDELPRMFRTRSEGSGVLQVSLHPPLQRQVESPEDAQRELSELLDSLGMDLGKQLVVAYEPCDCGVMATALYKSEKQGLVQYWLIPTEVTVFATYTMGSLKTAKKELAEAHQMLKTLKLEPSQFPPPQEPHTR